MIGAPKRATSIDDRQIKTKILTLHHFSRSAIPIVESPNGLLTCQPRKAVGLNIPASPTARLIQGLVRVLIRSSSRGDLSARLARSCTTGLPPYLDVIKECVG